MKYILEYEYSCHCDLKARNEKTQKDYQIRKSILLFR